MVPSDILHVLPFNREVNQHNNEKLHQLPNPPVLLQAVDKKPVSMKDYTVPDDEQFTGGLATTVQVAIGARVMLIRNVDVSDGLANGTQGEVVDIKFTSNRTPVAVLVRFDNEKVGKSTRMQSPVDMTEYPANVIPISRIEVSFSPTGNNLKIIRKQFPLKLCWASSIHTFSNMCVFQENIRCRESICCSQSFQVTRRPVPH